MKAARAVEGALDSREKARAEEDQRKSRVKYKLNAKKIINSKNKSFLPEPINYNRSLLRKPGPSKLHF